MKYKINIVKVLHNKMTYNWIEEKCGILPLALVTSIQCSTARNRYGIEFIKNSYSTSYIKDIDDAELEVYLNKDIQNNYEEVVEYDNWVITLEQYLQLTGKLEL